MIAISNIELYNILRIKLGEKEAQAVTDYIKTEVKDKFEVEKTYIATKQDVADAKVDMIKWMFGFFITLALMILGLYIKIK